MMDFSADARRSGSVQILLVEDSASDAMLTCFALKEGRVANEVHVVDDGEKALDFLHQHGAYESAPRPDLVLLDLNLPRLDGREVLAAIKQDPRFAALPVVVLTTSSAPTDIDRSYGLHANAYVTKPVVLDQFLSAVRGIEGFWLELVRLPDAGTPPSPT